MSLEDRSTLDWLRLSLTPGIGPVLCRKLLDEFEDLDSIFGAGEAELTAVSGVGPGAARELLDLRWSAEAERMRDRCAELGIDILTPGGDDYPDLLRGIPDPPLALYVLGGLRAEDSNSVAMVGCRNPDAYGESMAVSIASGLAGYGFTVTSGMALGIDAISQRSALKAGGRTVAVLGSGVDVVYPPEHGALHQAIIGNGAVLSEYPPGTGPKAGHFPRRNRIVSGMSKAMVMVQAMGERSGALITARHALEQGRDVYAVPGNAGSRSARMGNRLIKEGARLVETAEDLALDLLPIGRVPLDKTGDGPGEEWRSGPGAGAGEEARRAPGLPDLQARLYSLIPSPREGEIDFDGLSRQAGVESGEAQGALLELELAGLVRALPGKRYVRISD